MKRKILVIGAVTSLLVVGMLGGCSAIGGSSGSSSGSYAEGSSGGSSDGSVNSAPNDAGAGGTAPGSSGTKDGLLDGNTAALVPDAEIVTTGTISLFADDPIAVADKAVALVEAAGGHVDSRTEQAGGEAGISDAGPAGPGASGYPSGTGSGQAQASLVLRIPSTKVTASINSLKQLATVNSVEINAADVTTQFNDVSARITALQTSVNRLLDLMSKATTTTDLIALESTLSERQADLDGLTAQRNTLTDQVQYSSITLTVVDVSIAPLTAPGDFWSGLASGWASLILALAAALVALGVALPWIAVLAVVAAIVFAVVRIATRRSRPPQSGQGIGAPSVSQPETASLE